MFGSRFTLFARYSAAGEDAIIPSTVTGRDNINNVRPQNFVVGATTTIRPSLLNESRVAFNRFRQVNGLPELSFDVNGQATQLGQLVVTGSIRPWAAPRQFTRGGSGRHRAVRIIPPGI
jgi:hypothetical protein